MTSNNQNPLAICGIKVFAIFTHEELAVEFKEIDSEILVIALVVLILLLVLLCKFCSKGEKKTKFFFCFRGNDEIAQVIAVK